MIYRYAAGAVLAFCSCSSAFALDAACEPLLTSSEAKIAQPAWRSVHATGEAIKIGKQSFMKMAGKWVKSPIDLTEVERQVVESIKNGELKVTDCKEDGTETIDGKEMRVFLYTSEMTNSGIPAAKAKLYIGKDDGLPYLQTGVDDKDSTKVTYSYTDIKAPTL